MLQRLHLTHSPQRKLLAIATGSHTVRVWTTPEHLQRPSPARTTEPAVHVHASLDLETHHVEILGIQFLNAHTLFVIHSDGVIQCWHISSSPLPRDTDALLEVLPEQPDDFSRDLHCGVFSSCIPHANGRPPTIASGASLHAVLCWEIAMGIRLKSASFRAHSETGSVHAGLGGVSGEVLWLRFAQSGFLISRYLGHMYSCINLASLSHNGEILVTSCRDHRVAVWRPFGPDPVNTPWRVFRDSTTEIWSLALSHSSRYLAGGGINNGIYLWDLEAEDPEEALIAMRFDHTGWISELAWADQDRVLASSSWDNTVGVYRGTDLMPLYQLDLHTDYVSSVMFVPDTTLLVSASYDQQIAVWDWSQASLIRVIEEHDDWVQAIAFSGHGTFLSASSDRVLKMWSSNLLSLMGSFEKSEEAQREEQQSQSLERLLAASGGAIALQTMSPPNTIQQRLEGSLARHHSEVFTEAGSEPDDTPDAPPATTVDEVASSGRRGRASIARSRRTVIDDNRRTAIFGKKEQWQPPSDEQDAQNEQAPSDGLGQAIHELDPPLSSPRALNEAIPSSDPAPSSNPFARQGLRIDGESLSSGRLRSPSRFTEELSSLQEASLAAQDMDVLKLLGLNASSITILPVGSGDAQKPSPASTSDEASQPPPEPTSPPGDKALDKLRAKLRASSSKQKSVSPPPSREDTSKELSRGSLKSLFARHISKGPEQDDEALRDPVQTQDDTPETPRQTLPPSSDDVTQSLFGDLSEVFEDSLQIYLQQQEPRAELSDTPPVRDASSQVSDETPSLDDDASSAPGEEEEGDEAKEEGSHEGSAPATTDSDAHAVTSSDAEPGLDGAAPEDLPDEAPVPTSDEAGHEKSSEPIMARQDSSSPDVDLDPPPAIVGASADETTLAEEMDALTPDTNPFSHDEPTAVHAQEELVELRRRELDAISASDIAIDDDIAVSEFPSVDSNWDIVVDLSSVSDSDEEELDAVSAAFSKSADFIPETPPSRADSEDVLEEGEPHSLEEESAGSGVSTTGRASPHVLQDVDDLPDADDAPTTTGQASPPSFDGSSLSPIMRAALANEESASWFEQDPSSSSSGSPSPASTIGDSPTNPQQVREVTSSGGLPLASDASSNHGRIPALSLDRSRQSDPLLKEPTTPNDEVSQQERNDQTNPGFLSRIAADSSTAAPFMGRPITQSHDAYDSDHPGNVTSFGGLVYRPEVEPEPEIGGNEITADAFVEHDVSEPISQTEFASHTPEWAWIDVGELWKKRHSVNQASMKIFKRRGSVSRQPWVRQEPIEANLHNVFSLATRSESDYFAAGGATRQLAVWHTRGELLYQLPVSGRIIYAVTATPDGRILVCGDDRAHIDLWLIEMDALGHGLPQLKRARLEGHSAPISHLAMNTSGRLLFSAALDGSARLWNLEDGVCVSVLDHGGESLSACTFWGSGLVTISLEGVLRLWDRRGIQIDLVEGFSPLTCMAAKRSKIYFGSRDGEIFCYEKGQTTLIGRHDAEVTGMCLHLDGTLISASRDGTIKVHYEEGANPLSLQARAPLTCIEIDNSKIIAGTEQGNLEIFTQSRP